MSDLAPVDLASAAPSVTSGASAIFSQVQSYASDRNVQIGFALLILAAAVYYFWYRKRQVSSPDTTEQAAETPVMVQASSQVQYQSEPMQQTDMQSQVTASQDFNDSYAQLPPIQGEQFVNDQGSTMNEYGN